MRFRILGSGVLTALLLVTICGPRAVEALPSTESQADAKKSKPVDFITAEELKAKLDKNERVTVIDVRATSAYVDSDRKIKGAIHLKLRRLKYRLSFAPLKGVPRDSEVVTYCACANDEASIRAVQILAEAGFKRPRALKGGWQAWLKVSGQTELRPKG
jgi:rhodanese-related sulfurtransferase